MSNAPPHVTSSGLFAVLVCSVAASVVACGSPDPEKKSAWSCMTDEVPMGEVVRCTSSALTADGPVTDTSGGGAGGSATTEGESDQATTYECGPEGGEDCPPADTSGSGGAGGTSTTDGTSDEASSSPTGGGGASSTDSSDSTNGNGGGGGNGNGNGQTSDGASSHGSGGGGGGGSSHQPGGPDECAYVPDLPYCGGGGGTSDGASSSGGDGSGDCGKPNCTPPGQDKKGGTSDGASSSGNGGGASSGGASSGGASSGGASSGGASSGGGGKHWKCTKDKDGNKSCTSTPDCATGTHPSSCGACVSDDDGTGDCVPPSAGGCWVTGGGFIVAESLVPAAPADGHDNFGGNAKPMKDGSVKGHWNHVDHGTGNHASGRPEYIFCRTVEGPGPGQPGGKKGLTANQIYFGGHARWRSNDVWADGYWFDVVANDHGEPGRFDKYHFSIRRIDDPTAGASGTVVYDTKGVLVGGNVQLHPPNNGHPAVSSPLPAWVSLEP